MSTLLQHLQQLIRHPSITPQDFGCQDYIDEVLSPLGFSCHRFNHNQVSNLYAEIGHSGPRLVFAGHSDVVEPGPLESWHFPPFELSQQGQRLYGRGVADMKGSLAAMLTLAEIWCQQQWHSQGRLGFLITSGEEGNDYLDGTPYAMQQLHQKNIHIDYCIVGEPSSQQQTGDTIKIGRRGSLSAYAKIQGQQGHVAYPQAADNAIHKALPFLLELSQKVWDSGDAHFPPSTLQLTKLATANSANNIIPGELDIQFNIRFNPQHRGQDLQTEINQLALKHQLQLNWTWNCSGEPFLTQSGHLIEVCQNSIQKYRQQPAKISTSGGTSDARFIAPYGIEVIELGLPNSSIHQIDEHILIDDLELLLRLYLDISKTLLHPAPPH